MKILIDTTHTAHSPARTGIQTVCRNLVASIAAVTSCTPVTHDPYAGAWRLLRTTERSWLSNHSSHSGPHSRRSATWSWLLRMRGRAQKISGLRPRQPSGDVLVVPELFGPKTAAAYPSLFANVTGPRIALFHDAIALRLPNLSPPGTVARFPNYLRELARFDAIAAVSEDSRQSLLDWWQWCGIARPPPVTAIPLGSAPPPPPPSAHAPLFPATRPTILSVGTLEGRKNHIALLDACEQLWSDAQHPLDFELHLIGAVQRQTGRSALERIAALQSAGRPIRYDGPVDDATLEQAYARCAFTVYPSLMEGFGLPVLESVHRHRPCICRTQGALAEVAAGGGTLGIQNPDSTALALAIRRLLTDAAMLARLADEARQRPVRTWTDYTRDLLAWLPAIQRRATIPVD